MNKVYNGNLRFGDNGTYGMFSEGSYIEIENELDELLMSKVHIRIVDNTSGDVITDENGILIKKNDLGGKLYRFFVNDFPLDEVLFSISDREFNRTKIEINKIKELEYKNTLNLEVA